MPFASAACRPARIQLARLDISEQKPRAPNSSRITGQSFSRDHSWTPAKSAAICAAVHGCWKASSSAASAGLSPAVRSSAASLATAGASRVAGKGRSFSRPIGELSQFSH
jgi:hypothetical protein